MLFLFYFKNQSINFTAKRYIKTLKLKGIEIIFKNSIPTALKIQYVSISRMKWLMLPMEVIAVYTENYTKPINTKCRITDC
jgi:hypothetical protein